MNQRSATTPEHDVESILVYRRLVGWVAVVTGVFAAATTALSLLHRAGVLLAAALYLGLLFAALLTSRTALQTRFERAAQTSDRWSRLRRRLATGLPLLLVLAGIVLVVWRFAGIAALTSVPLIGPLLAGLAPAAWLPASGVGDLSQRTALYLGVLLALMAPVAALLGPYFAGVSRREMPDGPGLACWFRFATWVLAVVATVLLVRGIYRPVLDVVATSVLLAIHGLLLLEIVVRMVTARGRARRPGAGEVFTGARTLTDLFLLRLVASRFSPIGSLFGVLADVFGIDLKGTWALGFIRRSLVPLALGLLFLGWLGSSLVVVNVDEQGVRERFGSVRGEPLGPGLQVSLPWPIDRVRRVPVARVDSLTLGYAGQKRGASMLWTVRHSEEEYNLLVSDGNDLVTINGVLYYRVDDIRRYLYNWQNPVGMLQSIADRVMMRMTQDRRLEDVLSENLAAFSSAMEDEIQEQARREGLGIAVVDLSLVGLHPPVDVATSYQAVVGAAIERGTREFEGNAYRNRRLPDALARAQRERQDAEAFAVSRTAEARGRAGALKAQAEGFRIDPDLFRYRRRLERMEEILDGRKYYLVDSRFERDGGVIWLLE